MVNRKCNICQQVFKNKKNLETHMSRNICKKKYIKSLMLHKKIKKNQNIVEQIKKINREIPKWLHKYLDGMGYDLEKYQYDIYFDRVPKKYKNKIKYMAKNKNFKIEIIEYKN